MRPIQALLITLMAGGAVSGGLSAADTPADFPAPDAMLAAAISDGARLRQRLADGILGMLWQAPSLRELREEVLYHIERTERREDLDLRGLYAQIGWIHGSLVAMRHDDRHGPVPVLRAALDLQDMMDVLWPLMVEDLDPAPNPPGADQALHLMADDPTVPILARFGTVLAAATPGETFARAVLPTGDFDLRISWNSARVLEFFADRELFPDGDDNEAVALMRTLLTEIGDGHVLLQVLPDGFLELVQVTGDGRNRGGRDIDRRVLDQIPAGALVSVTFGLDAAGARSALSGLQDGIREEIEDGIAAAAPWQMVGMSWQEVLEQLDGTTTIAMLPPSPEQPYPGFAVQLPMTDALAAALNVLLAEQDMALPAPGSSLPLPLPMPVVWARNDSHLLLTSAPAHAAAWVAGEARGFVQAEATQQALSRAAGELHLLAISDTPRLLDVGSQMLDIYGGMMPAELRTMLTGLLPQLRERVTPGYLLACSGDFGSRLEIKSLLGSTAVVPMLAASWLGHGAYQGAHHDARSTANEMAMAMALNSGLFPAQIMFQAGAYKDSSQNNRGEFGFLDELTGATPVGDIPLELLGREFREQVVHGYRVAVFLPSGEDSGVGSDQRDAVDHHLAERYWVAYAWPDAPDSGLRAFALSHIGQLYVLEAPPYAGDQGPAWNSVLGEDGWRARIPAEPWGHFGR